MQFKPTEVNLSYMKINSMDRGAGLHLSTNHLQHRFASAKKTQGFGENNGDNNQFIATIQSVHDDDILDSNMHTIKF